MQPRAHIALELKEAGLLLPADLPAAPYAVPEGYFARFADTMLARLRESSGGQAAAAVSAELEEIAPFLASLPKKMPFAVPEGYFAGTAAQPSLLDSLSRTNVYAVPEGYFEALPERMLRSVAPRKAKVVGMGTRWMRIAAAAVLTGAVAIGGWFYESRTPATAGDPEAIVQTIKSVPDGALEEFIQTTDPSPAGELAQNGTARADVRSILHDVPVSEMDAFLDQVPLDDEAFSDIN